MRKRNIRYQLWLNEKEAEQFNKLVKRSGLPREVYLRQLIKGLVPTDAPPPDYHTMMKELRHIGINMNQIARKAHTFNVLDVRRYDNDIKMLNSAIVEITNAVMLPRKMEK
jgi:hypothetical protein